MWPVIGGLIGGAMNMFGQESANAQSAANVQSQEQFQQQMSSTAYQRASTDMKAAGLNPMMMFGSGSAASSPSGSVAQYQSPLQAASKSIDSTVSNMVAEKTMDKMTDEIANLKATNAKTVAETATEGQRFDEVSSQVWKNLSEKDRTKAQTDILRASLPTAQNSAVTAKNQMDIWGPARYALDVGSFGGKAVSDVVAPVLGTARASKLFNDRWYYQ